MHSVIDWNCIWKLTLLASRQGNLENGYEKEKAAERYDRSQIARRDGERRAAALEIDLAWSVLDIGAGPGTLALPLARRARQVTAVEPSSAMVKRLEMHIAEEGSLTSGFCQRGGRTFPTKKWASMIWP